MSNPPTDRMSRERAIGLRIGLIRAVEIFSLDGRHALYDAGERAQKDLIDCGVTGRDAVPDMAPLSPEPAASPAPPFKPRQLDFICAVMRTASLEGLTKEQFQYAINTYFDKVDPLRSPSTKSGSP